MTRDRYTRREVSTLVGLAGLGAWLSPEPLFARIAQAGKASDPLPVIPSWPTELRRLAPDIYAYTQASGPCVDNASLSNAGVIVGPEGLLAIDTLRGSLSPEVRAKLRETSQPAVLEQIRQDIGADGEPMLDLFLDEVKKANAHNYMQ